MSVAVDLKSEGFQSFTPKKSNADNQSSKSINIKNKLNLNQSVNDNDSFDFKSCASMDESNDIRSFNPWGGDAS